MQPLIWSNSLLILNLVKLNVNFIFAIFRMSTLPLKIPPTDPLYLTLEKSIDTRYNHFQLTESGRFLIGQCQFVNSVIFIDLHEKDFKMETVKLILNGLFLEFLGKFK